MVQECAGAPLVPADRAPLRSQQLPGWREDSEPRHSDRSWCGRPRPSQLSFPTPCHWFPGRVTLVTPSFNLLQRAWPADHISRGWQQTPDYWSPNGNYYFLFGCFSERPRHGDIPGTGVCFEPQGTDTKTLGLWAKVSGPGGLLRGEIIKLWLINQKSVTK